jgi:hypothetical protein
MYIDSKIGRWWIRKCKKYKILEWLDDKVVWYLYDKPKEFYRSIMHWFVCNWNKEHYAFMKQALVSYGWDGSFLYQMEEKMIDKYLKWFSEHQAMIDEQYNEIMSSLKKAKYLIHIINNDTDLFHYDGEIEHIPSDKVNEYGEPLFYQVKTDKLKYYYDGPYVNRHNARRFLTNGEYESEMFKRGNMDNELYLKKCKHLYHKIREKYTDYWWD